MKLRRDRSHEDALNASRAVMKLALSRIAYYGTDDATAAIAAQALEQQHHVYASRVSR